MLKQLFVQIKKFSYIYIYAVGYMCLGHWVFFRSRILGHCQVIMCASWQLYRMNIDVLC